MPFTLNDDDCEIYYETHDSGAAIAFVPGFMGTTDIWREQMQRFAAQF